MEGGSDGESNKINDKNLSEAPNKPKRQMKTPQQLKILESTYASEAYPSEATRAELSEKLGLSDRQLQMWFCHRRLKDKKEAATKNLRAAGPVGRRGVLDSPVEDLMVAEPGSGHGSRSGSGTGSGYGSASSQFEYRDDVPMVPRHYESPRSVMERRVIACVEAQLGEPLREDGPILGLEFDELPPGAFGAPIVMSEHRPRLVHSYDDNLFERFDAKPSKAAKRRLLEPVEPSVRPDGYGQAASSHFYDAPMDGPFVNALSVMQEKGQVPREYGVQGQVASVSLLSEQGKQGPLSPPQRDTECIPHSDSVLPVERKRKSDEAKIGREVQSHEKKIRKELEKQDLLRRKREEQMRKEMEKQDRERRKEEERMMRERQRKEERLQREERREMERREKFLRNELLKAEKRRQKEELRREKETARLKAAVERATARKIAKESMELIEDERLELMELAASSKGLPSMISLDHDTLQNLESFRDSLCVFPPKSVLLKRPFAIQPWIVSEENIGNLLMVWRFCMTFADVLGLWPFTLDEFVQAFHDYDSRLLGEIHVALLRLIIKDIEDVSRTRSGGLGTNQYNAANPEGGHPQIVEGAYLWGFDVRVWQKHLNPLTWPEILRQLALSAGFGPHLKKKNIEQQYFPDNDESKGSEDIVSNIRNGSAAENAVAVMQEKGFSLQRRSRHRLTPGTVKFAAYHVLSLEGSKGLTVLELAEKIQRSGLRDLTTSKTPEASISVALSRDPILFERIAPSTYCVRPAFRKDPANTESILSSAREKIQKYVNGFLVGENANDVERDDDSECDVAEGPEVDYLGTPLNANKNVDNCDEDHTCSGNGNNNLHGDVASNLLNEIDNTSTTMNQIIEVAGEGVDANNPDQGGTEIDESTSGELWVQGLTEGEYSDLCVEERLNALVAIISVANEGNSIRGVLEDRLDAANALKKQLWSEVQLDKRRVKEGSTTKFYDSSFIAEGSQSPLAVTDDKNNAASLGIALNEEPLQGTGDVQNQFDSMPAEGGLALNDTSIGQITPQIQQNGYAAERSCLQLKAFIGHIAEDMYVYRSLPLGQDRRRNRYWLFVASASRHDPGAGRIFVESHDGNWRLVDSEEAFDNLMMSLDTRGIRESHLHVILQKIEMCFRENVRRKLHFADDVVRGNAAKNEAAKMGSSPAYIVGADSPRSAVCGLNSEPCEPSSSFKIELGRNESEKKNAFKRCQDLQTWMWKECFNSSTLCAMTDGKRRCTPLLAICDFCLDTYNCDVDKCPSCHRTFWTLDHKSYSPEHVIKCAEQMKVNSIILDSSHPIRIRLLKAMLTFLEISVPAEALQSSWTEDCRKTWGLKLHNSSCTEDLLQILTQLEGTIKRDRLSSNFETTEELLGSCALSISAMCDSSCVGSVPRLPWIPQTTAAVALRLLELDASICYILHKKAKPLNEKEMEDITLPTRYASMKSIQGFEPMKMDRNELKKESWSGLGGGTGCRQVVRRQGGGRPRGRWQQKVTGTLLETGRQSVMGTETLAQVLRQQGQRALGPRHGRGPRTLRRRRMEKRAVEETQLDRGANNSPDIVGESPRTTSGKQWACDEIGERQIEEDDNSTSVEENESGDNGHSVSYEHVNWGPGFDVSSGRISRDVMATSDEEVDGIEDDDGSEEDDNENLEGDEDEDADEDVDEDAGTDRDEDGNENEGSDSMVSGDSSE